MNVNVTIDYPGNHPALCRSFSLPSRPRTLTVTAKAQPNSIGTLWMFKNLTLGVQIKAAGPAGPFSLSKYPSSKYLFISAGLVLY